LEFLIEITDLAIEDAEAYVRLIRDENQEPEAAERWFRGLLDSIYSLEVFPERCPLIPEQGQFSFEIRQLIYFSHRVIYAVKQDGRVVIYRVYHGSRRRLAPGDLH